MSGVGGIRKSELIGQTVRVRITVTVTMLRF